MCTRWLWIAAPYFAAVYFDKGEVISVKTQPNTGEHHGGTGHPHKDLIALKPNVIVGCGVGPGGLQSFRKAKVIVLKANADHVSEVVEAFHKGKLTELTGGCEHAHTMEQTH